MFLNKSILSLLDVIYSELFMFSVKGKPYGQETYIISMRERKRNKERKRERDRESERERKKERERERNN